MKKSNRILIIILIVLIIGFLAWYFSNIIAYIIISAALSFIGLPLIKLLDKIKIGKFKIPHSLNSMFALISIILIIVVFINIFVPIIANQASNLSEIDIESFNESFKEPIGEIENFLTNYGIISENLETTITEKLLSLISVVNVDSVLDSLLSLTGSLFIGIFAVLFITFFFLKDEKLFYNGIMIFVPEKYEEDGTFILSESKRLLSRYFIGICLEVFTVATLLTIGGLIIGLDNALLIGVIGGLFNIIPYLGPVIGATISAILVAATNLNPDFFAQTMPYVLGILGVFAVTNLIDNILLQPLIYSKSVKAHPIEIFIVIIMAGSIAGILGMILAIPVYTLFRIIARQFLSRFKLVKKITAKM